MFAASTWFPNVIQVVVLLPGWLVMSFPTCPSARNMLIVSSVCAFTSKSIGSDTTRAPFGIVNEGDPLKVSVLSVLVSIAEVPAEPFSGRAIVTFVIGRLVVPNVFEMRRRMREEGAVT